MSKTPLPGVKPIVLYDHLPGILAGYPAVVYVVLGLLVQLSAKSSTSHMAFWVGLAVTIVWYIAYVYNMPKGKFWLVFGLFGTFIGIPVALELSGIIRPFSTLGGWLGNLSPEVNAPAWYILGVVMGVIWLVNLIWSRLHLRVCIDESGLTLHRWGGKGERFDLIGLKTEHEPLDYLEMFIAGIGSLALKTRMNKPIFRMNRVVGLYRVGLFPFLGGKLARIDELLKAQDRVTLHDHAEQVDLMMAEDDDAAGSLDDEDQEDEPGEEPPRELR